MEKSYSLSKILLIYLIFSIFVGCNSIPPNKPTRIFCNDPSCRKPTDLWHLTLKHQLESNWVADPKLTELKQSREALIFMKVLKNGSVERAHIEESSGSSLLDKCALDTVNKSVPFAPLPDGMEFYKIVVIFTPKGLK